MSKFLKLCEKIENVLNEQEQQDATLQNDPNQPQAQQPPAEPPKATTPEPTQSEIPIVSNDKIAKLANALKIFYSNPESKLKNEEINEIKSLNPRNSSESEDIVGIIDKLTSIFDPVSIKTQPEEIKTSSSE